MKVFILTDKQLDALQWILSPENLALLDDPHNTAEDDVIISDAVAQLFNDPQPYQIIDEGELGIIQAALQVYSENQFIDPMDDDEVTEQENATALLIKITSIGE